MSLESADRHHDKAHALYRAYLLNAVRKAGSVANLAAQAGIPAVQVHAALDSRCAYIKRRNLCHEIGRKIGENLK